MSVEIEMKVVGVSRDSPNMPGMSYSSRGPFAKLIPFVFLSLVPDQPKVIQQAKSPEKLVEPPIERVRIRSESEGERDAEIIRPMRQWDESMLASQFPVVVTLSNEEFERIGRPTLGDRITLTLAKTD